MSVCAAESAAGPSVEALIVQNRGLVYHFAGRYARLARLKNIDPDDLVGEGMVALCKAAAEWRADGGATFGGFAGTAVQHAVLTALRRKPYRWRHSQLPEDAQGVELDPPDYRRQPEPGAALDVAAVLGQLQPRDRKLLEMRYLEGLTLDEIGQRLDICTERVRQLLVRALRRARTQKRPAGQDASSAPTPAASA
jgi:RNA polymerase sigma factor (sigma-70 family)